jgi:DNA topoisomerase VI subunit A
VIEKQATFDRVMQLRGSPAAEPMQRCLDTTVWITSRGFADHACAFLVHQLHCLFGGLRMYALCDNDPDGYFIYHTIKQGAAADCLLSRRPLIATAPCLIVW